MNKFALITGSSSGIGLSLAKVLASKGYSIILNSRNESELKKIAEDLTEEYKVQVEYFAGDLTDSGTPKKLYDFCKDKPVEILVNNAGFAVYELFVQSKVSEQVNSIDLNARALTELTYYFLQDMAEKQSGYILNVGSLAGLVSGGPLMSVYYATKAYVVSFTQALNVEMEDSGVKVSVLCPGPVRTRFSERANMENTKLFSLGADDADDIAKYAIKKMFSGTVLIIPGAKAKLSAILVRFAPWKIVSKILFYAHNKS